MHYAIYGTRCGGLVAWYSTRLHLMLYQQVGRRRKPLNITLLWHIFQVCRSTVDLLVFDCHTTMGTQFGVCQIFATSQGPSLAEKLQGGRHATLCWQVRGVTPQLPSRKIWGKVTPQGHNLQYLQHSPHAGMCGAWFMLAMLGNCSIETKLTGVQCVCCKMN